MSETGYKLGDLVWAKMKGFSPWPGRVSTPPKDMKKSTTLNKKGPAHCIFFFGTNNYAWIEESQIKSYHEFKDTLAKSSKTNTFKDALEAIEEFIAKGEVFEDENNSESLFDRLKEEESAEKKSPKTTPKPKKVRYMKYLLHGNETPKIKRMSTDDSGRPAKKVRKDSSTSNSTFNRADSVSPTLNHSPARKSGSTLLNRPTNVARPVTPPLDVETMSKTLKEKNISPSTLKFGFLGLGNIGCGVVKNLLNSGHKVYLWNRTSEKCKSFEKVGATECMTPSDVVSASDITFCCVADPQVARDVVFGNCGVLSEMNSEKSYVEMTGIDADTSEDIAEAVTTRGGRYLEAQVQGSKNNAEEGTLLVLAAGDKTLYDDCQSCFSAMSKNSFYLGEVGKASKMNLVLKLTAGVTMAGLAESMALADRAGLQQKDVLEILELTSLSCPAIIEKGKAIIDGGFQTQMPLKHMQKDLRLALTMGDQMDQPLPLAAAANEVYKHAKRLGYGDKSVEEFSKDMSVEVSREPSPGDSISGPNETTKDSNLDANDLANGSTKGSYDIIDENHDENLQTQIDGATEITSL